MSPERFENLLLALATLIFSAIFARFITFYQNSEAKYSKFTRLTFLIFTLTFGSVMYFTILYQYLVAMVFK